MTSELSRSHRPPGPANARPIGYLPARTEVWRVENPNDRTQFGWIHTPVPALVLFTPGFRLSRASWNPVPVSKGSRNHSMDSARHPIPRNLVRIFPRSGWEQVSFLVPVTFTSRHAPSASRNIA